MNPLDTILAGWSFIAGLPAAVLIAIGVPLMLFGAEWMVRGAVSLARRLGISTLVIGLTIVAAGTSAPELVVNIFAALADNGGLTFGNVIGSNVANIGLIIGIGALIAPMTVHNRVVRSELPWLIVISAGMVFIATPIAALGFTNGWGRTEGVLMCIGFIAMLAFWYRSARRGEQTPVTADAAELTEDAPGSAWAAAALFVIGLSILLFGGRITEVGAVKLATWLGLSQALIGMTVLAVSTSLPELVTTIVACRKGQTDLAVGNIVGSNVFNILLVLGVTATISEVPIPGAGGWQDLGVMMVFSLLLWWFSVTQKREVQRWEGAVLLSMYIAYMTWSVLRELVFRA